MNKKEKYADVFRMIQSVVEGESDMVANMANVAALLHEEFGFWWTGFYRVEQESKQLVLGPFQGPVACTSNKFFISVLYMEPIILGNSSQLFMPWL